MAKIPYGLSVEALRLPISELGMSEGSLKLLVANFMRIAAHRPRRAYVLREFLNVIDKEGVQECCASFSVLDVVNAVHAWDTAASEKIARYGPASERKHGKTVKCVTVPTSICEAKKRLKALAARAQCAPVP